MKLETENVQESEASAELISELMADDARRGNWLILMLKRTLKRCVDWSRIDKTAYLDAMRRSATDASVLKSLLNGALTAKINDREMFMKGIDYSYYYEEGE